MLTRDEFSIASPAVSVSDNAATIINLTVSDLPTRDYLAGFDGIARVDAAANCLQVGARALGFAYDRSNVASLTDTLTSTTDATRTVLEHIAKSASASVSASSETVPKRVSELLDRLRVDLQASLDPANTASIIGKLRQALITDYRAVTAKAREDLDLANPLSPLSSLRDLIEKRDAALQEKLGDILRQGAVKDATAAERARGTAKGNDFERALEAFITNECRPRHDLCYRTSTEKGFDGSLVGDFVIEIDAEAAHGAGLRIVIEAKNAIKASTALVRELGTAIKNRGAAFGITVINDPNCSGPSILPISDDKLFVRVCPSDSGDSFDMIALAVAIDMARWRAITGRAAPDRQLDQQRIHRHVNAALNLLNRFAELKKRLTATKTSIDAVAGYSDEIRADLKDELYALRCAVNEETSIT